MATMADRVMMRNMLERLKSSATAATEIVDVKGIDSIEELKELGLDRVDKLCSVVRKPGVGAVRITVLEAAQNCLMLAHYYLHHHDRIQRKASPLISRQHPCEVSDDRRNLRRHTATR